MALRLAFIVLLAGSACGQEYPITSDLPDGEDRPIEDRPDLVVSLSSESPQAQDVPQLATLSVLEFDTQTGPKEVAISAFVFEVIALPRFADPSFTVQLWSDSAYADVESSTPDGIIVFDRGVRQRANTTMHWVMITVFTDKEAGASYAFDLNRVVLDQSKSADGLPILGELFTVAGCWDKANCPQ